MLFKSKRFPALILAGITLAGVSGASPGEASNEAPVENNADDDDDMLQPEELNDPSVVASEANESAFFLGTAVSFGQVRPTQKGATPGSSYLFHFEPGYQVKTGSWNRLELSMDLFTGRQSLRLNADPFTAPLQVPVDFGMIVKLGYGYSLGSNVYALARAGVGPLVAHVESEIDGTTVKTNRNAGVLFHLGWILATNVTGDLDGTAGISFTHSELDVGRFEGGEKALNFSRTLVTNTPSLDVGLRYRF